MSFAINPSISHIDIPEANILELHRSKGEIQLADTRFRGHPCEAYICLFRNEKTVSAQVALLETGMNSIFVYTSGLSSDKSADYPKILEEAEQFTTSMGFTMERINLDFSPAMREVIVKGIKVMNPPKKRVKLRSLNPVGHLEPTPPDAAAVHEPPPPGPVLKVSEPAELQSLTTELASARTVIEKITREKLALEQSASKEISLLKASVEKAVQAKQTIETELRKEIAALKAGKPVTAGPDKELLASLQAELETARRDKEGMEKNNAAEIARFKSQMEELASVKTALEREFSAKEKLLGEKVSALTAENSKLAGLLAAEKSVTAEKNAALIHLETALQESQQREEDLCRNIDALNGRVNSLETEIQGLTSALPEQTALEDELKNLTVAKNEVEAEYVRMANEAMAKEAEMIEALYNTEAEIMRLSRELELQQKVADMEMTALRNELRQLVLSGAISTKQPEAIKPLQQDAGPGPASIPVRPAPARTHQVEQQPPREMVIETVEPPPAPSIQPPPSPQLTEEEMSDAPVEGAPKIFDALMNEFGSIGSSGGYSTTEFTVIPDIDYLEYSEPGEVVALLYSSNSVQAMPDNTRSQRCKGYVIGLKQKGEYRAYVAWYLTESGKVVLCAPDQQPANEEECTQILQDAVAYFEIVGFQMELEDLGSTVKSYYRAIKKVPALRKK